MTGRDWTESAGIPKVEPAAKNLSRGRRDERPMTHGQVERNARLAQHGACVDHVKVVGVRGVVCILPGQDPAVVAAEAAALVGGGDR